MPRRQIERSTNDKRRLCSINSDFNLCERIGGKNVANLTSEIRSNDAASDARIAKADMKFEIVVIPVSDVDRAKEFYGRLGWRLDAEFASGDDFRVIQFTPPGAGC